MEIREEDRKLEEEKVKVADAMEKYGGGFVRALATCIMHADIINLRKIKKTWPEYWNKYLEMSK